MLLDEGPEDLPRLTRGADGVDLVLAQALGLLLRLARRLPETRSRVMGMSTGTREVVESTGVCTAHLQADDHAVALCQRLLGLLDHEGHLWGDKRTMAPQLMRLIFSQPVMCKLPWRRRRAT